ncbi:hypothetical protein KQI30_07560 [Clostridium bornimense]|uniref:hypothetical protein n=1 Tax=Clostridium bornimense TaxID=1216932 RepID=UPI001C128087|nr:hypothetical protein [Clostridium bornimense]MBU5316126.1 hypothetical protein [Clostridium bornimense]
MKNVKNRSIIFLILMFIVVILILIIYFICYINGRGESKYDNSQIIDSKEGMITNVNGIAVDNNRNVYLGVGGKINVYNSSAQFIHSYLINTAGSYSFTIDKNQQLIISDVRGERILKYKLDGNYITKEDDYNLVKGEEIDRNSDKFITTNGEKYKLSNTLFFTKIYGYDQEGKLIFEYSAPLWNGFLRLSLLISIIMLFISFFIAVKVNGTKVGWGYKIIFK